MILYTTKRLIHMNRINTCMAVTDTNRDTVLAAVMEDATC